LTLSAGLAAMLTTGVARDAECASLGRAIPTPIGAIGYRIESAHSRLGRGGPTFKPPKV
jgi:hypothetical protein